MTAGVVTLLSVRDACKQESDNVGQSFISDAEWNGYIQRSYQGLYGRIVEAFGNDYFVQSPTGGYTFTTDGTNNFFALPDGSGSSPAFFKLLGVDVLLSSGTGQWVSLTPFAFADRNRAAFPNTQIPQAGQTVRVFYVPRLTVPTQDSDTIDGVNGWEDWIICEACMVALTKEESDVSVFGMRLAALEKRLEAEIENRNATEQGGAIVDVYRRGRAGMQYRLNGNNLWLIGGPTPMAGYGYWDYDAAQDWNPYY